MVFVMDRSKRREVAASCPYGVAGAVLMQPVVVASRLSFSGTKRAKSSNHRVRVDGRLVVRHFCCALIVNIWQVMERIPSSRERLEQ